MGNVVLTPKEKNSSVGKKNWPEHRANLFPPEPEITPVSTISVSSPPSFYIIDQGPRTWTLSEYKLPTRPSPLPLRCPSSPRVDPEPLTHQSTSHQHPPCACSHSAPRAPQHSPTGKTPGPHTAPHPARCSHFQGRMSQPSRLPRPGHSLAADTPPQPLPGSRSHHTQCPRSRCARPPPALSTRCLLL